MRSRLALLFSAAALLGAAQLAHGSILLLPNGDRLTGKVIKREHGKIYFHSQVLGDVVAQEKDVTIVESPSSPTPTNSMVGLPPAGAVKTVAPATAARPAKVAPAVTGWTGKLELGYDNQLTNIRTINTTARVELDRTDGPDDYLIKARYLYGSSADLPTTDLMDGEFRVRHNLDSQLFVQSDTTAGDNHIQLINFEGQEAVGVGLKLVKTARATIDVGTGVTGQYLNAEGVEKGWDYLGNVFEDYTYKINGIYTFTEDASAEYSPERRERYDVLSTASTTVPELSSAQDYAYKFHTSLQGQLSKHLSLNLHFEYEYNNAILDPTQRGEQRITTTLGYGF